MRKLYLHVLFDGNHNTITAIMMLPNGRSGGIRTPEDFSSAPKADPVPGYGLHSVKLIKWLPGVVTLHLSPKATGLQPVPLSYPAPGIKMEHQMGAAPT